MRVLVSPGASATAAGLDTARALAGTDGVVIESSAVGVRNLRRRLSQAEVHAVRRALLGSGAGADLAPRHPEDAVVGYVCTGVALGARGSATDLVAVTDHANLTWYSPLTGANDDSLGPRFPVTAGMYEPARTGAVATTEGIVACVWDETALTEFEERVIEEHTENRGRPLADGAGAPLTFAAASAELASVALLAAHLGFHLAAVVMTRSTLGPDAH